MATCDVPIIDLAADDKLTDRLERACRDVGFFYLRGHRINGKLIERMRKVTIAYFSRPSERKLRDRITRDNYRGYIPLGFFSANSGNLDADSYEGYKLHFQIDSDDAIVGECNLYGPNKWPDEPADLRSTVLEYWSACDRVARELLELFAAILELDPAWFVGLFDKPLTNMTLLHYPPQDAAPAVGIHPHKDTETNWPDAAPIAAAHDPGTP